MGWGGGRESAVGSLPQGAKAPLRRAPPSGGGGHSVWRVFARRLGHRAALFFRLGGVCVRFSHGGRRRKLGLGAWSRGMRLFRVPGGWVWHSCRLAY